MTYNQGERMRLLHGDMRTVLATLEPESVHACVTDPPYELSDGRKASADLVALEFMFPENAKIKAEGAGDDCLPLLVHEVLALSRIGIVPTPPPTMPVGAVAFDQDAAGRDGNIEDSGEGAIFVPDGDASGDGDTKPPKYLGYFHLELTDRVSMLQAFDRAGTGFFAGGIGVGFGVTPSRLPSLVACDRPINLGDHDVRARNDALAHLIGALAGAEHLPVARLDVGRTPVERLATNSALMLCAVLLSGGAKLVRTCAAARRLPSMLEARRVRIVHPLTHRAVELDLVFHPQSIAEKGFMGKEWDGSKIAFDVRAWKEVYRVLKPGGYLLAFSGTRTYHEMASAIAMAGFEIREMVLWVYGSGMPKGLNVSKAIDKAAGAEREVVGTWKPTGTARIKGDMGTKPSSATDGYQTQEIRSELPITIPATDAARAWDGWNSAIKPACEPVCVARKPFKGTIANNVLAHGTGAYHVDACRIHTDGEPNGDLGRVRSVESYQSKSDGWRRPWMEDDDAMAQSESRRNESAQKATTLGRWPANVCLDESAAAALDAMSGERPSGGRRGGDARVDGQPSGWGTGKFIDREHVTHGDTGGASRFFFIAQPDCWLCGNPKRGTMNATNHARGGECCEPANTAESSSLPSTSPADSVAGVAPDLQPLRLGDNSPEASTFVSSAASTSMSGQGTSASTAQRNAIQHHAEHLAPRVSDVGNLCERCGIAIAQSLASHSANHAPSPVGPGSIGERNARILNLSLALFAESQGSTDTTLTTASLKLLFGYVRDAIAHSTLTGATETESGQTTRLKYSPKSSQAERNIGHAPGERNTHATVKPIDLMQWLVRLVTVPGGTVLDPFMGSGSTGIACSREGFQFIGIDLDEHNVETARKRITGDAPLFASIA